MRYQVWVEIDRDWCPMSRPFDEDRYALEWALDLTDWFRTRVEIRVVE